MLNIRTKLAITVVRLSEATKPLLNSLKKRLFDYLNSFRKAETISEWVVRVVFNSLSPVLLFGLFGYIIVTIPREEYEPFELAIVSALLGGFTLAGGFASRPAPRLATGLRRVGALYIASTIAFVVFGLYITLDKVATPGDALSKVTQIIVPASFYVGAPAFTWATAWLVTLVPQIWKKEKGV